MLFIFFYMIDTPHIIPMLNIVGIVNTIETTSILHVLTLIDNKIIAMEVLV